MDGTELKDYDPAENTFKPAPSKRNVDFHDDDDDFSIGDEEPVNRREWDIENSMKPTIDSSDSPVLAADVNILITNNGVPSEKDRAPLPKHTTTTSTATTSPIDQDIVVVTNTTPSLSLSNPAQEKSPALATPPLPPPSSTPPSEATPTPSSIPLPSTPSPSPAPATNNLNSSKGISNPLKLSQSEEGSESSRVLSHLER